MPPPCLRSTPVGWVSPHGSSHPTNPRANPLDGCHRCHQEVPGCFATSEEHPDPQWRGGGHMALLSPTPPPPRLSSHRPSEAVGLHPPVGTGCWVPPPTTTTTPGMLLLWQRLCLAPPSLGTPPPGAGWSGTMPTCASSPGCVAHGCGLGRRVARVPWPPASCRASLADAKNRLAHMWQAGMLRRWGGEGGTRRRRGALRQWGG